MLNLIGIDVGGTKCAVTAGFAEENYLEIVDKKGFATDVSKSADEMMAQFYEILDEFIPKYGADVIGISCGGPLDSKRGVIMSPPNLPGWDNIEAVKYFKDRFGVPTCIQNDANACAFAEYKSNE